MAEQIKLSSDEQEKILLHLVKRIEDIEQALALVYAVLKEEVAYREPITRFLKEKLEGNTDETPQSLIQIFEQIQDGTVSPLLPIYDVLQKANIPSLAPLPPARCGSYENR